MEDLFLGKDVIVANTFINYWEIAPYIWLAKLAGVDCIVYEPDILEELKDGTWAGLDELYLKEMHYRCTHGVPIETIEIHIDDLSLFGSKSVNQRSQTIHNRAT